MEAYSNSAKIKTGTSSGEIKISINNSKQIISATNNRAKYYAELAEKYKNEAKEHRDNAQYYAEKNSDVTFEYIDSVKEDLETKISTKQNLGDYALKSEIPIKVSELTNDMDFTTFDAVIPEQIGNEQKVLCTNGKNLFWETNSSYNLFDIKLSDHILDYEETKGWALQGTYVYKDAVAGSRYGYPNFYARCLDEYNEATNVEAVNGIEVKVHSNGHKFYDIADKEAIDSYFDSMGSAWFYGIDIENERVFLPRNNYFVQLTGDISDVGNSVEAGLPNITAHTTLGTAGQTGAFIIGETTSAMKYNGTISATTIDLDASYSSPIYGKSNTVQPNAVMKLLYICVGNTANYENMIDVVDQGMDILEQVNYGLETRVNLDATNLSNDGRSLISSYIMPSDKYIDLTLGATDTIYTAPANGWFTLNKISSSSSQYIYFENNITKISSYVKSTANGDYLRVFLPCKKGDSIKVVYNTGGATNYFRFVYAEGEV